MNVYEKRRKKNEEEIYTTEKSICKGKKEETNRKSKIQRRWTIASHYYYNCYFYYYFAVARVYVCARVWVCIGWLNGWLVGWWVRRELELCAGNRLCPVPVPLFVIFWYSLIMTYMPLVKFGSVLGLGTRHSALLQRSHLKIAFVMCVRMLINNRRMKEGKKNSATLFESLQRRSRFFSRLYLFVFRTRVVAETATTTTTATAD